MQPDVYYYFVYPCKKSQLMVSCGKCFLVGDVSRFYPLPIFVHRADLEDFLCPLGASYVIRTFYKIDFIIGRRPEMVKHYLF